MPLVQVAIVEDSAADTPARSLATAAEIASELLGRRVFPEPAGPGCWLVEFTDEEWNELQREGIFERSTQDTYLLAEMP